MSISIVFTQTVCIQEINQRQTYNYVLDQQAEKYN